MKSHILTSHLGVLTLLLVAMSGFLHAEIYRWQDAQGRWHFSDQPREGTQSVDPKNKRESENEPRDLVSQLTDKYGDLSGITKQTLAVVSIQTRLGSGSGFFIHSEGYLITNKHVVRPTQFDQFNRQEQNFENRAIQLENWRRALEQDLAELKEYSRQLKDYKDSLQPAEKSERTSIAWKEYLQYEKRYKDADKRLREREYEFNKALKAFNEKQQSFKLETSIAGTARNFKVLLKDETELNARLVKLSDEHDLALLKVDTVIVPHLDWRIERRAYQGDKVFAIGSPLGVRDAMTAGIVARNTQEYILTDAQILPGNSGGPLLDSSGELLGVNTLKLHTFGDISEGFGAAIPSSLIEQEFGAILP